MATSDKLRDINPQDCFVTNAAGAIVGVQAGADISTAARFLNEAQVSALAALVPGAGMADSSSLTLTAAMSGTTRIPAGTQTYTIDAATGWAVGDGAAFFLPTSGAVSFAVSGGPTLNGATTTLTRTLAGNTIGYVVLNRIAGAAAYSLSGA